MIRGMVDADQIKQLLDDPQSRALVLHELRQHDAFREMQPHDHGTQEMLASLPTEQFLEELDIRDELFTEGYKLDRDRKVRFLKFLAEHGQQAMAAAQVGVTVQAITQQRTGDKHFDAAVATVLSVVDEQLKAEARRRAYTGQLRNVYHKGEVVGVVREYSDSLLTRLLETRFPDEFKHRSSIEHDVGNLPARILAGRKVLGE